MSREKILADVKKNQPIGNEVTVIPIFPASNVDLVEAFTETMTGIGGRVFLVDDHSKVSHIVNEEFKDAGWVLSLSEKVIVEASKKPVATPKEFEPLDLLIIDSTLAIAENGAIWITENEIKERVLPFITQHLAVVIEKENIVATMHRAYELIGDKEYGFATFIAGPSKTADIEQSLVLGAHGPKTMTVFIL
jgi:L-lactate dehydrogenase complex protein LldG